MDMVCIVFNEKQKADECLTLLRSLKDEASFELLDACIATRDEAGKVHLEQSFSSCWDWRTDRRLQWFGSASADLVGNRDVSNPIWSVGGAMTQPIFLGGALNAQVKIRTAEQRAASATTAAWLCERSTK
jgi:hypothetical protein